MAISLRELQVISRRGKPTAVVVPIKDFQELLELAEDRYDVAEITRIKKHGARFRPLEEILRERRIRV